MPAQYSKGDFINGEFVPVNVPDGEISRINPADPEDHIGDFPYALNHVDQAVQAARQAFLLWSELSESRRWTQLKTLRELIYVASEALARSISRDIGKPIWEARQEVQAVLGKFQITEDNAMALVRDFSAKSGRDDIVAQCRFKPRGVLAVLSPFNFPLHLAMGHIIPALACGNTVVLKPSELAPSTAALLSELFAKAQFPKGVFNLVFGEAAVGRKLCQHPEVQGILFTGSYAVGKSIEKALIDEPGKIVVLEMGGKNASLIWEDAVLPHATDMVLQSATLTSGQRCTSTSRLFVHRKLWPRVKSELLGRAAHLMIGDPMQEDTYMGPLVSAAALERFKKGLPQADDNTATFLEIPELLPLPNTGAFVAPSFHLMQTFDLANPYCDSELFGPDLAIYLVDDLHEAMTMMEKSRYGFAVSVFSRSRKIYQNVFDRVTAGVINWNRPTTGASSHLPFGGQKASGNQFPTALFAPYYCSYPVASLQDEKGLSSDTYPGFSPEK